SARLLALARLRRHREAFLHPRPPQRRFAGNDSGRLIAVVVEVEHRYDRAGDGHDVQGGGAGPRLVEPQQDAERTLADVLHHAAQRRGAYRCGPTLARAPPAAPPGPGPGRADLLL